jgi:hypothetical protein
MDNSPENKKKKNPDIESAITAKPLESPDNASGGEATNLKRRRALLAGLAAVPVLITLKSRSAFSAQPTACSIVLSINLEGAYSQHPGVQIDNSDINRCDNPSQTN